MGERQCRELMSVCRSSSFVALDVRKSFGVSCRLGRRGTTSKGALVTTKSFRIFAAVAALALVAVLPACAFPGGPPPPPTLEGQNVCESFGGTFADGAGNDVWTCTGLPILTSTAFQSRRDQLFNACLADGGVFFHQSPSPPQDGSCLAEI